MVYAKASKGFKSGGFNGRANTAAESTEYDPETVWSYEAGVKTRWFDQLTLNATVFHNDYKDFQKCLSSAEDTKGYATKQEIKDCFNQTYNPISNTGTTTGTGAAT